MKTASQTTPCPDCGHIEWSGGPALGFRQWLCLHCGKVVSFKTVAVRSSK